jgi:hypothetical protein
VSGPGAPQQVARPGKAGPPCPRHLLWIFNEADAAFYYPGRLEHWIVNTSFKAIEQTMMDIIYVGVMLLFFVISGLYVLACDKM